MGDALKKSAGDRLRELLERFTSSPLRAVLTGIVVTALIQSSSGTAVLAVGLVNSGFMTLRQSIGVVMGANVGTTVTSFIIGIDLGAYALPILGLGSILMFFFKNVKINNAGQIILGFGMLFFGLELMGSGMEPLQEVQMFHDLMTQLSHNPFLAVTIGVILTVIMQSSSATIGILQKLYAQGSIALSGAFPLLFGDNIGTTITAIIACVGASTAAKRVAGAHVMFNLIGTIIFMLLLSPFTKLVMFLTDHLGLNPALQIAVGHGLFNTFNLIIQFKFIPQIATLMEKIIPEAESDEEESFDISHLDEKIIHQSGPEFALLQSNKELLVLGRMVKEQLDTTISYYHNRDEVKGERVHELELYVNKTDRHLTQYLGLVAEHELSPGDSNELTTQIDVAKYLERIGDHAVSMTTNIGEAIQTEIRRQEEGRADTPGREMQWGDPKLEQMIQDVQLNVEDTLTLIQGQNPQVAQRILDRSVYIHRMEGGLRNRYIQLIREGKSRPADNILFIDIVASLERISDHTRKVAGIYLERAPQNVGESNPSPVMPN